ncbi:MAG: T9SS type A sorting domain-containing protein [Bacteroidetes bacterium]|nr:T9SS type A sorting domain-containing protein [Bacteroidota bacterium]
MKVLFSILSFIILISFTSKAQKGLDFDGSDDYVQTTYSGISGNNPRTVEMWIKANYLQKQQVMFDYGDMATGTRFTFNMIDGKLRIEAGGNGVTGTTRITDTTWHHVAVTYNNSASPNFRTYIDGVVQDSFNLTVTINTASKNSVMFGRRNDATNYYFGSMDEVRMWNYARSHAQIKNNYQKELCDQEPGLVLYHKMNHGVVNGNNRNITTSIDYSKNGDDGTLNNFSLTGSSSNWVSGKSLTTGSKTASFSDFGCDSYTTPSGKTYTQSGTYKDTFDSYMGCDSIITINLTVKTTPTKTINVKACDFYVSPAGKYIVRSGTYKERIKVNGDCDTILTINALIGDAEVYDTIRPTACQSYTSPSGKFVWDSAGRYTDTLQTWLGCDSIIIVYLTLLQNTGSTSAASCSPITSPSGKYVYSTSGIYSDTLTNVSGCDSVITVEITIYEATTSSIDLFGCTEVNSPSGIYTYTANGTYTDTIPNKNGCDSIITVNISLGEARSSISLTGCNTILSPSGKVYYNTSGTYQDTLATKQGCDSILTINATVNKSHTTNWSIGACESYTSPKGNTWTVSGKYIDSFKTVAGCDSLLEIDLVIDKTPVADFSDRFNSINNTYELEAKVPNLVYNWLECTDSGKISLNAGSTRNYVVDTTRSIALVVSSGACSDTSECKDFEIVSVGKIASQEIAIYPNPNNGDFAIELPESETASVRIYNSTGKLVYSQQEQGGLIYVQTAFEPGVYVLKVIGESMFGHSILVVE